ncbi:MULTISPECIES: DUF6160 family protein [Acinetobacter]|uniref:DUF6160 family protein n=1 Tax=Acinetobacter TaxID=469 RepID=UPI0005371A03|nr:DUF6160 family protein [Acinetobacter sp. HR7]KGT48368.1 hypothetical protein GW12_06240 [Acinetobacter sp. HR7]
MKKALKLKTLTICIVLAHQQAYALEKIAEQDLSSVTGQDGLVITHEISKATAEQINWYDPQPNSNTMMGIGLHNFNMEAKPGQSIKSQLEFDVGATEQGAGIRLAASISPFTANADLNLVKTTCSDTVCGPGDNSIRIQGQQDTNSLGEIGLSTSTPLSVVLQTNAGLFNKNEKASIDFRLQNATISHQLGGNSLILNDFNFNFAGQGYMYVASDEGLVLTSRNGDQDHYINLGRVTDTSEVATGRTATNPGVNIDLRYNSPDAIKEQYTENGIEKERIIGYTIEKSNKNLIRMGASGAVTNARLALSGDQTKIADFDIGNKDSNGDYVRSIQTAANYNNLVGAGGLHLALSADFTSESDTNLPASMMPTTLEIGHTGKDSYAIEFSKIRPLTTRDDEGELHGKNAYIDFGNIYLNTVGGKELDFIVNDKLKTTLGAEDNTLKQILSDTPDDFALIAIRGFDFQAIAAKARFISDNSLPELTASSGSWGIGIPVYNLNANVALKGTSYSYDGSTKQGIGYNIMASTEGYGIDAKTGLPSTTSIILIDGGTGKHGEAVNYYAGLRNIDAFIESKGVIGYENRGILISAEKLVFAANAELAIGQLPGSKYNCTNEAALCGTYVAHDSFAKRDDVLTNIAFMIDGSGQLLIIPGVDPVQASERTNFLSYEGKFKFSQLSSAELQNDTVLGSYLSISNEDVDELGKLQVSALNLNKMQGEVGLNGNIRLSEDTVVMDNQVNFNPSKNIADPFRVNFAMQTNSGPMQKIADIALTGGTIRSTLGITPR